MRMKSSVVIASTMQGRGYIQQIALSIAQFTSLDGESVHVQSMGHCFLSYVP